MRRRAFESYIAHHKKSKNSYLYWIGVFLIVHKKYYLTISKKYIFSVGPMPLTIGWFRPPGPESVKLDQGDTRDFHETCRTRGRPAQPGNRRFVGDGWSWQGWWRRQGWPRPLRSPWQTALHCADLRDHFPGATGAPRCCRGSGHHEPPPPRGDHEDLIPQGRRSGEGFAPPHLIPIYIGDFDFFAYILWLYPNGSRPNQLQEPHFAWGFLSFLLAFHKFFSILLLIVFLYYAYSSLYLSKHREKSSPLDFFDICYRSPYFFCKCTSPRVICFREIY